MFKNKDNLLCFSDPVSSCFSFLPPEPSLSPSFTFLFFFFSTTPSISLENSLKEVMFVINQLFIFTGHTCTYISVTFTNEHSAPINQLSSY